MTPRENVLSCLRRSGYERVPFEFNLCPALREQFIAVTGCRDGDHARFYDFPIRGGCVYRSSNAGRDWAACYSRPLAPGTTVSEWGVAYEPGGNRESHHLTHMLHPMESFDSLEQFQSYPWPEVTLESVAGSAEAIAATKAEGYASALHLACSVWETSWYLRGMETLMVEMMTGDEKAVYLLDRVMSINARKAELMAAAGVDILWLGDDIGMQRSMMMAPELWMEWLQPRLKRIIDRARAAAPGPLLVMYHTCGFARPAIPGLIAAGIDVLNPVQPECMDFESVHAEYGDRLSFHGTIGTQTTMPFGTAEDVRRAVWRNLELAAERGGLMPAPTHMLEPEVPWENIDAFVRACREFEPGP